MFGLVVRLLLPSQKKQYVQQHKVTPPHLRHLLATGNPDRYDECYVPHGDRHAGIHPAGRRFAWYPP